MMRNLAVIGMMAALALLTASLGGCPFTDGLSGYAAPPADSGPAESADGNAAVASETTSMLEELASDLVNGNEQTELARSEGSTFISTRPDSFPEGTYPPGYNPYSRDNGSGAADSRTRGGASAPEGSGGAGDGADSGGSGGGSRCDPEPPWYGWPGDYNGSVDCVESEWLSGYGELTQEMEFCISMAFDAAGVPDWIPIPVFASSRDRLLQVDVHFVGESAVYSAFIYDVTVTVVSAAYTPTSADVVLDIDLRWVGASSSIKVLGVHTLRTQVVGDSLVYRSQTHYDGSFFAAANAEDWEADATQDFDCSATLLKP